MEVRDAETGELLVLRVTTVSSPEKRVHVSSPSSSQDAVTQSQRKLGDSVAWQRSQLDRIEVRRADVSSSAHEY